MLASAASAGSHEASRSLLIRRGSPRLDSKPATWPRFPQKATDAIAGHPDDLTAADPYGECGAWACLPAGRVLLLGLPGRRPQARALRPMSEAAQQRQQEECGLESSWAQGPEHVPTATPGASEGEGGRGKTCCPHLGCRNLRMGGTCVLPPRTPCPCIEAVVEPQCCVH